MPGREGEWRRNFGARTQPAAAGRGIKADPRSIGYRRTMTIADSQKPAGPWNPGVLSQVPKELRSLSTILRPENVFTGTAAAEELHGLTGFGLGEIVVFQPQRLALHELLIRVTSDFTVPDGFRIGDLGINFRQIASRILTHYLEPEMDAIVHAFDQARRQVTDAVEAALTDVVPGLAQADVPPTRAKGHWLRRLPGARRRAAIPVVDRSWGPAHIADCERKSGVAGDPLQRLAYRTLARVLSALFAIHGQAWGTRDLIVQLARDMAGNVFCSDVVGRTIEPLLQRAAQQEGYGLLPRQQRPIVINTKGPSASGKSTLRPLQKKLAGDIGVNWSDFALISPDIWRKQLLDYGTLGAAYKYAGALTAEELQIVDQKLDRYMAQKYARGDMSHLLIDRFRFDSFAPESDEEGSNFLTRFGQAVYLFFVITPPEMLVERAWKRGLEFGRYKAVDDTLAHAVEAYTGIPNVFFTWVRRSDKRIQFEFLDNTVPLGQSPRTVAFGGNDTINVLDVGRMLNIDRYGRVCVDATSSELLYPDRNLLAAEHNVRFLRRCVEEFRYVNFADQASGRIYLRIEFGIPVLVDAAALETAVRDLDARAGVRAVAPRALSGGIASADRPHNLRDGDGDSMPTLGVWGEAAAPKG